MVYIVKYKNITFDTFGNRKCDAERWSEHMNKKYPDQNWFVEERIEKI